MPRIPMDAETKKKIIELYQQNKTYEQIGKATKKSYKTVSRTIHDAIDQGEITQRKDAQDDSEHEAQKKRAADVPERPIDKGLQRRAEQKIIEYGSDAILADFKVEMRIARILHEKELKYRTSVETMGVQWESFMGYAIDWGYDLLVQAWKKVRYEVSMQDIERMAILNGIERGLMPPPKQEEVETDEQ
jgi:AAA15 family ATPase/GTPase